MMTPSTLRIALLATVTTSTLLVAQGEGQPKPITAAQALKLGPENLTDLTDPSEAGQDQAALLYATAKRLQTESTLAKRDLQAVLTLKEWRDAIHSCRESVYSLAYIINGGGTMYSHGSARDIAEVEDFLASFAQQLPLAEGVGDANATQQLDEAMAFLKKLKVSDLGDAETNNEAQKNLKEELDRSLPAWESLKFMIGSLPAAQAKQVVAFTVKSLTWLKEE